MNRNNLLRRLSSDDAHIIAGLLTPWSAALGELLYEPGDTVQYSYFPLGSSLVSYLVLMDDGRPVETALIGHEGAVGGIASQGRVPAYARAEVQYPGEFFRISVAGLEEAKTRSATLRNIFARYADCLVAQLFQGVACCASHTIEQRTAKWLLAASDRTGTSTVAMTQEQLGGMLGVGRSYVSRVVGAFKQAGVIDTSRSSITIVDRGLLTRMSCSCNDHVRRHFETVLQGVYPINDPR